MRFGLVERATRHPDGVTPETDTTHTVMLMLIITELLGTYGETFRATYFGGQLDLGVTLQYALVHDLPEAYAGDTNTTIALTDEQKREKEEREARAVLQIAHEVGGSSRVVRLIREYEAQEIQEARFVRYSTRSCRSSRIGSTAVPA